MSVVPFGMRYLIIFLILFSPWFLKAQEKDATNYDYFIGEPCENPEYPGGYNAMKEFLNKNMQLPGDFAIEGKVYISFMVDTTGKLSDFQIKRSLHKDCDDEAIRLFKLMPKWIPAKCSGKVSAKRMTYPMVFKRE